nr:protein FANTASTIC FOUR 3 [Ipomoea trifida]
MSTIVYQQQGNLQSCFEPQIFEITATLKLKVPPPCTPPCQDLGGWSMLQSLTGIISRDAAAWEKEAAYVHPLARRWASSSARLSEKSLALCTEALGSETGTDMIESSSIFSSAALIASPAPTSRLASPEPTSRQEESLTSSQQIESRNVTSSGGAYRSMNHNSNRNSRNNNNNFPPPLTTISGGANSLRVKPHREGGRLIIRAVETPSKRTYLQAERSNGRLRLSFFNADQSVDYPQINTSEENDVDVDGEEFNCKEESDEVESDINGEDEVAEVQELEVDEEKEEEEGGEEESDVYMARDMDGNTSNVEVEMGIKKCLLGRCKESGHSNKGLSQWREPKTLWVST